MDTRHEFFAVERFGQVVIGTETEPFDLALSSIVTRQDQNWGFNPR